MRERMTASLEAASSDAGKPELQPRSEFQWSKLPVKYPASYWKQTYLLLWRGTAVSCCCAVVPSADDAAAGVLAGMRMPGYKKIVRDWQRELMNYSTTVIFALIIAFFFFMLGVRIASFHSVCHYFG
jgi:hypothetical protein